MRTIAMIVLAALTAGALQAADQAPRPRQRRQPMAKRDVTEGAEKTVVYKKASGTDLKMYIHLPPDWKAADKRPGIVFFFGGGWTGGTPAQFIDQAEYLASRGMVAARADYRVKGRQGVTPDQCVEDAKSAVRYLRAHAKEFGIDPGRIVASGGSAGGHIAACTATTIGLDGEGEDKNISSKPTALLLFNPALNFAGEPKMMARLGSDREKLAKQISPTVGLTKDTPPALLLFGSNDFLLGQCKAFMARAKEVGHKSEVYLAEGQSHGFFNRSPWRERTLKRADEFLAGLGYLKGKPTIKAE